jgi:uncharacterized protein YkwD
VKRAILLGITTVVWVVASQVISGAIAPSREITLTTSDLAASVTETPEPVQAVGDLNGVGFAVGGSFEAFLDRLGRSPASTFSVEDIPLPSVPVTTVTVTSTTDAPTATAPVTTTTRPATTTVPPTTAPPATTTPPPATTSAPATTAPASSGSFNGAAEANFVGKINALRSSVGVSALANNDELNNYARWWAQQMAVTDNFAHSNIGSLLNPWTIVGENIAYGGSVDAMFNGLVNSTGHYNNMVETRFTSIGVGVFVDAEGQLWTCHVFAG